MNVNKLALWVFLSISLISCKTTFNRILYSEKNSHEVKELDCIYLGSSIYTSTNKNKKIYDEVVSDSVTKIMDSLIIRTAAKYKPSKILNFENEDEKIKVLYELESYIKHFKKKDIKNPIFSNDVISYLQNKKINFVLVTLCGGYTNKTPIIKSSIKDKIGLGITKTSSYLMVINPTKPNTILLNFIIDVKKNRIAYFGDSKSSIDPLNFILLSNLNITNLNLYFKNN